MFTTHDPFRFPIQFDRESTIWRAVELELPTPWYVATVHDSTEDCARTFLLTGSSDLEAMVESKRFGVLESLQLVLPPNWSGDGSWRFVPIRRVDLRLQPSDGASPDAVVQAADGTRYGGFPIEPLRGEIGPLKPLADLVGQIP